MTFEEIIKEGICGREARRDAWRRAIREEVIRGKERVSKIFPRLQMIMPRWVPKETVPKETVPNRPIERIIEQKPQYNNPNTAEGAVLGRGMAINV